MIARALYRRVWPYVVSLLTIPLAVYLRWLLVPVIGTGTLYLTVFPAIIAISFFLGTAPGVLASVVGVLAAETFLTEPVGQLHIHPADLVRMVPVVISAVLAGEVGRRRRAALARAENEKRWLQAVMQSLPVGVAITDAQGGRIQANDAFDQVWGGVPPPAHSVSDYAVYCAWWAETGRPVASEEWASAQALRQGVAVVGQVLEIERLDGSRRHVINSASPVRDADGGIMGSAVAIQDITELRRVRQVLSETEERFHQALDNIPDLVAIYDHDLTIRYVNGALCRLVERPATDFIGKRDEEIWPSQVYESYLPTVRRTLETAATCSVEASLVIPRKGPRSFAVTCVPLLDDGGDVREILCIARDLTEQKAAMELLRRYELIAADTRDIVLFMRCSDGRILEANAAAVQAYGYSREELLSLTVYDLRAAGDGGTVAAQMAAAEVKGILFETVHRRRDGSTFPAEVNSRGATIGGQRTLISVVRDITERKQLEEERQSFLEAERAARAEAERLVRLKDEFLATVSHELRSPLNAIVGWTRLLARGGVQVDKAVDILGRSASSLAQIVEDLLDTSRMVSGKIRLSCERVDLLNVIMNALDAVRFAAEAKGVKVEVSSASGPVSLNCDPNRIQQIVWNLLTNAIKFTPRGGRVNVSVNASAGQASIVVADTGQGICPEFLPQMFQRFRQQDGSIARRHGGLGLGLAIVRQLVEMHGGTVQAHSDGPGLGATFTVILPLSDADQRRQQEALPRRSWDSPPERVPDPDSLAGVRVLAVDDDAQSGELLAQLLREAGAVVEDVQDALTALRRLDEFKPDVIVSDVGMPDIDGYSFIRQLRGRTDVQASVPCLALTALARPEDREQALAAGFNEHLPKPCDPGVLIGIVRSLVAGRAGACVPQAGSVDDAALAKGADGTGAHILLAEDNASISAMLQQILESEGYRVSVAESVVDAVARADETPVHLLLSDLRLRDGMGWDLLKTLRARGDVPGIVMSGYSESMYVTRSKQAGFAEFLVKPVDADELLEVIRRVLSQSTPAGS